ncbi:MAG: Asp-tRNA(Asn)/Glu-tRNA(Gln) amidotransferase subunit GatC [Tissierellia bacterium]|nr:Asp-tRNA(Asn)/Glu-tRNA(Gln) amidotransferase subunit GatC [Tissierellia bacterium]
MELDKIKHIASISQLSFSDEELVSFSKEFNDTFEMIKTISNVNTEGVENTYSVNVVPTTMREDIVKPSLSNEEATKNTVEKKYGYFSIIKYVE